MPIISLGRLCRSPLKQWVSGEEAEFAIGFASESAAKEEVLGARLQNA